MHSTSITYIGKYSNEFCFNLRSGRNMNISMSDVNICRIRFSKDNSRKSIMINSGYIRETLSDVDAEISDNTDMYIISSEKLVISINKSNASVSIQTDDGRCILKTGNISGHASGIEFNKNTNEHFYGFGFQRKTLDANGHKLTFKREYRWNEATVPYFLSSSGYGFFSANTYDHTFDFTESNKYSLDISGGNLDFFIMYGPDFSKIISSYTALTGRPPMVPAWSLGLCYVARLFETQEGLLNIASTFRKEGIPCDMLGLEPGWEKHYYQMKWIWNNELFPDPKAMISKLHDMGYAFELWESGDAPISGYMNADNRKSWFSERVESSLDIGVDFYKQDDPYPRCITSEEMVINPKVDVFIKDDGDYTEAETKNIANTLYSTTVYDEMRKITGKRAFIIFHSYGASTSSQMYPCAWAGDFNLGNGALNASLSGHAMVTQDMRNETPAGIHFGFLMPFVFMDSWAYYLEPWLFADHIKEMIKFYSRLRVSLFPYLYTALWQSHTKGLPLLRPMLLEYQYDSVTPTLDKQFMLGDNLLVGINPERGSSIYLPKGNWIDYWTKTCIESSGNYYKSSWPSHTGGSLYVKAGAIIPMTNASDSISLNKKDFLLLDIYPDKLSSYELYEDDGITYAYEKDEFSITTVTCEKTEKKISIDIGHTKGNYHGQSPGKAVLFKVFLEEEPLYAECCSNSLSAVNDLDELLYSYENGWFYSSDENTIYIKTDPSWKFHEKLSDSISFYNGCIDWQSDPVIKGMSILITTAYTGSKPQKSTLDKSLNNEFKLLPADCEFNITVNPPERVRLNHGDDWLSYNIFVGFEIVSNGQIAKTASPEVKLDIACSDEREIIKHHTTNAYEGVGHFEKIVAGSPSEPPDILLTLSAEGIPSKTIRYTLNVKTEEG